MAPAAGGGRGLNQPVRLAGSSQRWLELERLVGRTNLQMGQNPIRNPTNPFPPYKSSPPNPIQPSTLIIQTTPNHCIISSQTKLNCLTVHGFNPLESISQSMVSVHGFRALSSARWDMDPRMFSLASLNLLASVLYFLLAETWINAQYSLREVSNCASLFSDRLTISEFTILRKLADQKSKAHTHMV